MKVLIVTFEFSPFAGGIAAYTHQIATSLARLDCRVRVLAPAYRGSETIDRQSDFETTRMNVSHGRAEAGRFIPGIRYLEREMKAFKPDVALLTSDLAHGVGAVSCGRRTVPFVAVVHGSEIVKHFPARTPKRYLQSLWLRRAYRKAHLVICVSRYVRGLMLSAGFDGGSLVVVHNGIDDGLVKAPPCPGTVQSIRERHKLVGKSVILTLARLVARKGQADMINAMPMIRSRHPDACYVIAGTGGDEPRLRALAKSVGVERSVVFAGEIPPEEKTHYLDLCDVYVLPSRSDRQRVEGLGIGLLEAAARAKPLVAARHGGISEIIDDGVNGYLVDLARPGELAERVIAVLDNPTVARSLGEAARNRIVDDFLADKMAGETKRHLEMLLAREAGRSPPD